MEVADNFVEMRKTIKNEGRHYCAVINGGTGTITGSRAFQNIPACMVVATVNENVHILFMAKFMGNKFDRR